MFTPCKSVICFIVRALCFPSVLLLAPILLLRLSASQADHLVRRGRPLVQQESVDLDVPEEKIPKRASTEILEAERLEDLETCMVGYNVPGVQWVGCNCP